MCILYITETASNTDDIYVTPCPLLFTVLYNKGLYIKYKWTRENAGFSMWVMWVFDVGVCQSQKSLPLESLLIGGILPL